MGVGGSPWGGGQRSSAETGGPARAGCERLGLPVPNPSWHCSQSRRIEGGVCRWPPKVTGNRGSRSETPSRAGHQPRTPMWGGLSPSPLCCRGVGRTGGARPTRVPPPGGLSPAPPAHLMRVAHGPARARSSRSRRPRALMAAVAALGVPGGSRPAFVGAAAALGRSGVS